ncbi:hypothetical protein, partial [Natronospira sp.]
MTKAIKQAEKNFNQARRGLVSTVKREFKALDREIRKLGRDVKKYSTAIKREMRARDQAKRKLEKSNTVANRNALKKAQDGIAAL